MNNDKKQSWYQAVGVWRGKAGGWAVLKNAGLWCLLLALGSLSAAAQQKTVAGGGPIANICLPGANTNPIGTVVAAAEVSPGSLTFANQQVGTASAPQTVTLSNTSCSLIAIRGIGIVGTNAGDFTQSNNCGASLAAHASCDINVTFRPTSTGPRTAAVAITTNAGNPSVALSGTGIDFAIAVPAGGSNTAAVGVGETASYGLSIGASGAAQTLAVSCTGARPGPPAPCRRRSR